MALHLLGVFYLLLHTSVGIAAESKYNNICISEMG